MFCMPIGNARSSYSIIVILNCPNSPTKCTKCSKLNCYYYSILTFQIL